MTTRNLVYGNVREYHVVERLLKPFFGPRDDAVDLPKRDTGQYDVDPYHYGVLSAVQVRRFCMLALLAGYLSDGSI